MESVKQLDLNIVNLYPPVSEQPDSTHYIGELVRCDVSSEIETQKRAAKEKRKQKPIKRIGESRQVDNIEPDSYTCFTHVEDPESFTDHRASVNQGKARNLNFVFGGRADGSILGLERSWHPSKLYEPHAKEPTNKLRGLRKICLRGHLGRITCMTFGHIEHRSKYNGGLLFSGSADRTIKVWDPSLRKQHGGSNNTTVGGDADEAHADLPSRRTGKNNDCVQTMVGHTGTVNDITFCESSKSLFSCSVDGTIIVWRDPAIRRTSLLLYPWFESMHRIVINTPCPPLTQPNRQRQRSGKTFDLKTAQQDGKTVQKNECESEEEVPGAGSVSENQQNAFWWPSTLQVSKTKRGTFLYVGDSLGYLHRYLAEVSLYNAPGLPLNEEKPANVSKGGTDRSLQLERRSTGVVQQPVASKEVKLSLVNKFRVHELGITKLSLLEQQQIIVTLSYDGTAKLFDAVNDAPFLTIRPPGSQQGRFVSTCWDNENFELFLGTSKGGISIWNIFKEKCLMGKQLSQRSSIHYMQTMGVTISPELSPVNDASSSHSEGHVPDNKNPSPRPSSSEPHVQNMSTTVVPASSSSLGNSGDKKFTHLLITVGPHLAEYELVREIEHTEFLGHQEPLVGIVCTSNLEKLFAWEPCMNLMTASYKMHRRVVEQRKQSTSARQEAQSFRSQTKKEPSPTENLPKKKLEVEKRVVSLLNQLREANSLTDGAMDGTAPEELGEANKDETPEEEKDANQLAKEDCSQKSGEPVAIESRDDCQLFSVSQDSQIRSWDEYDATCQGTLRARGGADTCAMANVRLGKKLYLVTGHEDGSLVWWEPVTSSQRLLCGHANAVCAIHVAYQERISYLITGDYDGNVCLWELVYKRSSLGTETVFPQLECQFRAHDNAPQNSLIASLLPQLGGGSEVLAIAPAVLVHPSLKHFKALQAEFREKWCHSGDARMHHKFPFPNSFLTSGSDCTVRVWSLNTQTLLTSFTSHSDAVTCMECHLSCVGPLLFTGSDDCQVHVLNLRNLKSPTVLYRIQAHAQPLKQLRYIPGMRHGNLVTCSLDGTAKLWHCALTTCHTPLLATLTDQATNGESVGAQRNHSGTALGSAPDNSSNSGLEEAQLVFKLNHTSELRCLSFNPLTLDLFVGAEDNVVVKVKLPVDRVESVELSGWNMTQNLQPSFKASRKKSKYSKDFTTVTKLIEEDSEIPSSALLPKI